MRSEPTESAARLRGCCMAVTPPNDPNQCPVLLIACIIITGETHLRNRSIGAHGLLVVTGLQTRVSRTFTADMQRYLTNWFVPPYCSYVMDASGPWG